MLINTILPSNNRIKKPLLLFFLILCFGNSYGQQTHSFSGIVGKHPVYLQITITGYQVDGIYFYKNKLIDIPLKGTLKAGVITLNTTDGLGNPAEDPETILFKWPNKLPEGTWTKKGKSLQVQLMPLTARELSCPKCSNSYLQEDGISFTDLTKVKIGLFRLKETKPVQTTNGINVRFFKEINTNIELFRIDSGLVAAKQKEANSYLEYLHVKNYLEALNCAAYSANGSDYSFNVSDITLSKDLMSFSVFIAYYCGGAHPEEATYGINYHLSTQQKISLTDFLISGKTDSYENRIYHYLAKKHPEYFQETPAENSTDLAPNSECNYYLKELWTAETPFTLTHTGIRLHPFFAHYQAPCLDPEWAVIPYSEIKDLVKPDYYSLFNQLKH